MTDTTYGAEDDVIDGDTGIDVIDGGDGIDTIDYSAAGHGVIVDLAGGSARGVAMLSTNFNDFTSGTIDGQQGWVVRAVGMDQAIVDVGDGDKALRLSNAASTQVSDLTSPSFGPFGETGGINGTPIGRSVVQEFDLQTVATSSAGEAGLTFSASFGQPASIRMTYLELREDSNGVLHAEAVGYLADLSEEFVTSDALEWGRSYHVIVTADFIDGQVNDRVTYQLIDNTTDAIVYEATVNSWEAPEFSGDFEPSRPGTIVNTTQAQFNVMGLGVNSGVLVDNVTIRYGEIGVDTLLNIENVVGTELADVLIGSDSDNVLSGLGGADTILGGSGDDTLNGGADADTMTGGAGDDTLDGGSGTDTATYTSNVTVEASGSGWTVNAGSESTDTLSNVEIVEGLDSQVLLVGNGGFATIQEAIDAAEDGDTVLIASGTYDEALSINGKAITLEEAVGETVILQAPGSTNAITLSGNFDGGDVVIKGLEIIGAAAAPNQGMGVYVTEGSNVGKLTIDDVSIHGAGAYGVFVNGDDNTVDGNPVPEALHEIAITNSAFSNNGYNGASGSAHIKLFGFSGNATIQNVTIDNATSSETPVAQRPDYGIDLTGTANTALSGSNAVAMGTVVIANVTMTGWLHKNAFAVSNYGNIEGLSIDELDLATVVTSWGPVVNIDGILANLDASGYGMLLPGFVIATELQGDKLGQTPTNQTIVGTDSWDRLIGKGGDDHLIGGDGNDELYGHDKPGEPQIIDDGDDWLEGGSGDDYLSGGAGNDRLDGGADIDQMAGGLGDDTYLVDEAADVLTEGFDAGTDTVESSATTYTLTDEVENLTLTGDAVSGIGNALNNELKGNAEDNTLDGQGGKDTVVYTDAATIKDSGGGWSVTTAGGGTDTLSNIEIVDDAAGGEVLLVGYGGYASIADAIAAADSGDTIQVAAGNWTLPGGDSGKDLTFLGANAGLDANEPRGPETIIDGAGNFRFGGNSGTFDGFTFTGQHFDSFVAGASVAIRNSVITDPGQSVLYVIGSPDNVQFTGNHITGVTSSAGNLDAIFIGGDWDGTTGTQVDISGNVFEGSAGVSGFNLSSVHGTIADNVIDGLSYYGFLLANDTDVDVTGNTFQNIVNPDPTVLTFGAGVRAYTPGTHFGLNLDGNDFVDNAVGLGIRTGSAIDPAAVTITNNTFTGNGNAVVNQGAATTDISLGDSNTINGVLLSGATEGDLLAIANNVVDGVDLPGVGSVVLKAGNVYLTVNSFVAPLTDEASLQRALDTAHAGDTVHVGAGSYSGDAAAAVDNLTITAPLGATGLAVTLGSGVLSITLQGESNIGITGNGLANVITGNAGENQLLGGAGDDVLAGGGGADFLVGSTGNDRLDGGAGDDTMAGGVGDDTYGLAQAGDTIIESAGQGIDTVESSIDYTVGNNLENLTLLGGANLNGTGNGVANTLIGNSGNNVLDGGIGADAMKGALGDDTYLVDDLGDEVTELADQGSDLVISSVNYTLDSDAAAHVEDLTLTGAALNATGNARQNVLTGNDNNNVLDGLAGADTMKGGKGADTYYVDDSGDMVVEASGQGTDSVVSSVSYTLASYVENASLTGSADLDLSGNNMANALTGNTGSNVLDGKFGADTMTGGLGNDTYHVDNSGDAVMELAGEGTDSVISSVSYTLTADVEDLTLTGAALNATGNAGDNVLTGNANGNVLDGKAGADTMDGGDGDDTYYVNNPGDVVVEASNQGTDIVYSSVTYTLASNVDNLTLTGSANRNGTGNADANALIGNSGNNVLDGGIGADTMTGGLGDDTYYVDNDGDMVTEELAGEGTDTVISSVNYTLTANVDDLTLTGAALNGTGNTDANNLKGNANNNILDGGAGADTMRGGDGDDTYYVDNAADQVVESSGRGTDLVYSSVTYRLMSNVENLTLTGSDNRKGIGNGQDNILIGNSGNNVLDGKTGADTMAGGLGDDTYRVDNIDDVVTELAGEGTDSVISSVDYALTANVENLTLTGAAVNGTGNAEANALTGNAIGNVLDGGEGADTMVGDDGDDTYYVDDAADQVEEASGKGTDIVYSSVSYTLAANVENLTLTEEALALDATGNGDANVLTGNGNNNGLDGQGGADTMAGGDGDDSYVVDNGGDVVTELANEGTDSVTSSVSYTLTANVENLTLTGGAIDGTGNVLGNTIVGNLQDNNLDGGEGNDHLSGGDGIDILTGGNGDDDLNGDAGADTLLGDAGNDRLDGGTGADFMLGGADNDTYVVDTAGDMIVEGNNQGVDTVEASLTWALGNYLENLTLTGSNAIAGTGNSLANVITGNEASNTLTGGAGSDTFVFNTALNSATNVDSITDFSGNDLFNLSDSVFTALNEGTLTAAEFTIGASATDGAQRIVYDQANGTLSYDADGSGAEAAIQFATVTANTNLTHDDFVVI